MNMSCSALLAKRGKDRRKRESKKIRQDWLVRKRLRSECFLFPEGCCLHLACFTTPDSTQELPGGADLLFLTACTEEDASTSHIVSLGTNIASRDRLEQFQLEPCHGGRAPCVLFPGLSSHMRKLTVLPTGSRGFLALAFSSSLDKSANLTQ